MSSRRRYPQIKRQSGLGLTGYLVVISVCVFVGTFVVKIGPHYAQYWTVSKVADDLASKPEVLEKSRSEIYKFIDGAFRQNNIWDLKPEDTIVLTRDKTRGHIVNVKYERRTNLFHNIDVVTSFDKTANQGL
ncbi:MAG: DUF4845 domain-containing protein [Granulosicoccus sp.]